MDTKDGLIHSGSAREIDKLRTSLIDALRHALKEPHKKINMYVEYRGCHKCPGMNFDHYHYYWVASWKGDVDNPPLDKKTK